MNRPVSHLLAVSPNWLGDAVMALPAIADMRRAFPSAALTVAARFSVADVFTLAPLVDRVVTLEWTGRWWQRGAMQADAARLRALGADAAILLPNSFAAAWLVWQAGVRERWGFSTDMRGRLLTRAVPRPPGSRHQGAYYQYLTRELDIDSGPLEPAVTVSPDLAKAARDLLAARGWDASTPFVALAPGAAYGGAKRWTPSHVARLASALAGDRRVPCVLVGSRADAASVREIEAAIDPAARAHVLNLAGETTVPMLAGVLAAAAACVAHDSGAMHLAAAVGTPVVAIFGPTSEYVARPLTREGRRAEVLTHDVWCRPCLLRECPIDHRCMKGITPDRVLESVLRHAGLQSGPSVGSARPQSGPSVRSARLQPGPSVRSPRLQPGHDA